MQPERLEAGEPNNMNDWVYKYIEVDGAVGYSCKDRGVNVRNDFAVNNKHDSLIMWARLFEVENNQWSECA